MSDRSENKLTKIQEEALHDLENILEDAMPSEQLDTVLKQVNFGSSQYDAIYKVGSLVFYQSWRVLLDNWMTFEGESGGLFGLAALNGRGTLYTDNLTRLYQNTRSFMYTVAPGYIALYFYDGNSNIVGHLQGVNIAPLYAGVGGGKGRWR